MESREKSVCSNCEEQENNYYCDIKNPSCLNLKKFKDRIFGKDLLQSKCTIKDSNNLDITTNLIMPYFYKNKDINTWITSNFGHWEKRLQNYEFGKLELDVMNCDKIFQFLMKGLEPTILEMNDIFQEISDICFDKEIGKISILDFKELSISQEQLKRYFAKVECEIIIIDTKQLFKINKIGFGRNIADSLREQSSVENLNILTNDEQYITRFKRLADEMDKDDFPLRSLWSKSTHDIGLLTSGKPMYKVLEFNFPIKKNAEDIPKPAKAIFVQPNLVGPASKMLQALCDTGIIARGYSKYNAPTHFIPKSRPELTLQKFISQGGEKKDFVAGLPDKSAPQLLRMVNHFKDLNEMCYNNPVTQLSTTAQLKQISKDIKYCSVMDITGCFHSIALSKKAQELTGFDSGLTTWGRMFYKRVPMGTSAAKNIQDNALLMVLSNINGVLIYSDNIIILSMTKDEHFEAVRKVWEKLRDHGLKCKASKSSIMKEL